MALTRRTFLTQASLGVTAGGVAASCDLREPAAAEGKSVGQRGSAGADSWEQIREQFALAPGLVHMSALLISSHPKPVRDAIEEHRRALDADPVTYLNAHNRRLQGAARAAAARYLGVETSAIALTDSTTMGLGLVYNGLRLKPGDEILAMEDDYYATHESIRLAAERTGARVRKISLYQDSETASEDDIVQMLAQAITPATRVVALTWVHSSTGLKIPARQIAGMLNKLNANRGADARILFCLDGVHGLGNQDVAMSDLGCDFFIAGCHKWLFGPRGTGIIAAKGRAWEHLTPTIPSFIDQEIRTAWFTEREPADRVNGSTMSPGGFKAFEHQWALTQAFEFHQAIGKSRIAKRTAELAAQLKEGLAKMSGVRLRTPRSEALSAGIVCFDVDGMSPSAVVARLSRRKLIASVTPYARAHARLTPSIYNTPAEVDTALREIHALAD